MRTAILLSFTLLLAGTGAVSAETGRESAGLDPISDSVWTPDHAAHLLRRAGFGGTPAEIDALFELGPQKAVDSLLDWSAADPGLPRLKLEVTSRPGRTGFRELSREQRQAKAREFRRRDRQQQAVTREWWIRTMIRTRHPARERLALFWHGHFTSSYRDVRNSYHIYIQNTTLRRLAGGSFRELLHEISRDPAMLEYLDNNRNRKGAPNENYAREVMELFTLGEGHYSEGDIKQAARALTGWTFSGNRFRFDRSSHDDGPKTILGRTGNFDGAQFLDILLDQPQAYRWIARRLFRYFAHPWPAPADIDGLAQTLKRSDWQLKPMLRRLFLSKEFYSRRSMGTRIKGPVDLLVGLHRSLGMDPVPGLSLMAANLGQSLMDPPNVKGWPGGRDWITTSMLLQRYNLASALVGLPEDKQRTMRSQKLPLGRMARMMRESMEGGEAMQPRDRRGGRDFALRLPTYDVVAKVREAGLSGAEEIVDHFARALLAVPVAAPMKKTLLDQLTGDRGFDLDRRDARERLHRLLRLIVSTPEFQLS